MLCVPRWHMDQWNLIDLGWYGVGMGGLALKGCTRRCYARPWLESLHVQTFTTRAWHGTHQIMFLAALDPGASTDSHNVSLLHQPLLLIDILLGSVMNPPSSSLSHSASFRWPRLAAPVVVGCSHEVAHQVAQRTQTPRLDPKLREPKSAVHVLPG